MKIKELKTKKILVLGFGREGKDTLQFLQAQSIGAVLGVADQISNSAWQSAKHKRDGKTKWHPGKNYLKAIKNYGIIIKSPGIPPKMISPFLRKGQIVTSQTEIFFDNCPGTIVGVTGTKGKSTTASMIYQILKKAGFKAYLVGNIGRPALSSLLKAKPDNYFVYELSSHQLAGLKKSPHIAVLLNIYPEHLDYYKNFEEYARAKANIAKWQKRTDYLIFNTGSRPVRNIARQSKAQKIPIRGKYYELDRNAARAVAKILKIQKTVTETTLKNFRPLEHRLEFAGTAKGISFYNDSLATIPEAAMEALDYLGRNVETLIAGGFDRGVNFDKLAQRIIKSHIKTLILFPPSGLRMAQSISKQKAQKVLSCFVVEDMKKAVALALRNTQKGKICLMSPASPSFGLFQDYRDRGNSFKRAVKASGKSNATNT